MKTDGNEISLFLIILLYLFKEINEYNIYKYMEQDTDNNTTSIAEQSKHMLNSKWIVWYHNPSDQSWTIDSYKDILEIQSVEDLVLKNMG